MIMTPAKTPRTVPLPPKKLAPPIIQAAIASSSAFNPALGYPESALPANKLFLKDHLVLMLQA